MTAYPPFDAGATHDNRTWPDTFVGTAVSDRTAVGTGRGTWLTTLLAGPYPAALRGYTRK